MTSTTPGPAHGARVENVRPGHRLIVDAGGTVATVARVSIRHDSQGTELFTLELDTGARTQPIPAGSVVYVAGDYFPRTP